MSYTPAQLAHAKAVLYRLLANEHPTMDWTGRAGVISSFTDDEITMEDSGNHVKAQPGSLSSAGNAFSVVFKRST